MKIDEAIAHAKEVAEKQRKDNDNCIYKSDYGCKGCTDYYYKPCNECAKEHEQLAEWLEELKAYRKHVFSGDMTQLMLKEERNKALDDLVEAVKITVTEMDDIGAYDNPTQRICEILKIEAERLKAGK